MLKIRKPWDNKPIEPLKLNMVGVGDAFSSSTVHSGKGNSFGYLEFNHKLIMIDCGSGALEFIKEYLTAQKEAKYTIDEIIILVTHTHPDHICDLTAIAYHVFFALDEIILTIASSDLVIGMDGADEKNTVHNIMVGQGVTEEFLNENPNWRDRIKMSMINYMTQDDPEEYVEQLVIGSFKQDHFGVDAACGFMIMNQVYKDENDTTMKSIIVYSGDTSSTTKVRYTMNTTSTKKMIGQNTIVTIYHEASIYKTKAHSNINELVDLGFWMEYDWDIPTKDVTLLMYHLSDNAFNKNTIYSYLNERSIKKIGVLHDNYLDFAVNCIP